VARHDTLEDHIESLSDEEEDDFIVDKKVLIQLKKTVPPSPDFLENLKLSPPAPLPGRVIAPQMVHIMVDKSIEDFASVAADPTLKVSFKVNQELIKLRKTMLHWIRFVVVISLIFLKPLIKHGIIRTLSNVLVGVKRSPLNTLRWSK
jgi:hypothetical protein